MQELFDLFEGLGILVLGEVQLAMLFLERFM
jgi:hypothetical protein